ncbi:hypothetical protein [Streptantibioticus parmotrematis]|uniref:hypothetical protein n=1 Tax=Streptantibioticus parmotrematis TaxID=2873249 RepID=UPI00207BDEDD|nr:hypothetical protein [Streptantibioticus parmotrematis]
MPTRAGDDGPAASPGDEPTAAPGNGRAAHPGSGGGAVPVGPTALSGLPAPRRPVWAERAERLRSAATTEPGRLRLIAALLTALLLAFGTVAAWQTAQRGDAARAVATSSQPLSADAAEIYRSLADADTTAATGFLVGGAAPADVTNRYGTDVRTAAQLIAKAAAHNAGSPLGQAQVTLLSEQLPVYTGLVETARADNRQGLPLGGAYLRYANEQMAGTLLPAAQKLYRAETGSLGVDYAHAEAVPWAALALGAVTLAVLAWAQRRLYRRTRRVFNPGLLAGFTATAAALLWLAGGQLVARADLHDSWAHGARSLEVLNAARIDALQARGDENLTLVARGGDTQYETLYERETTDLAGPGPGGDGGLLGQALALADEDGGRAPVRAVAADVVTWRARHQVVRADDTKGDYDSAVAGAIGGTDSAGHLVSATTGQSFDAVDAGLRQALDHETGEFQRSAGAARDALDGVPQGAAALAALAVAGALVGVSRRLSEYR